MKKQIIGMSLGILVITAVSVSAFTPPQNDKNQKKEQGKNNNKGNQGNKGNPDNKGNQGNQGNKGNKDNKGNQGNNPNDVVVDTDNDKGKSNKGKSYGDPDYKWDRETFKDRGKARNQSKVTVCHKFNRDGDPGVTINVSSNALKAHMGHGDVMGNCPTVNNGRFSDIFMRRRADYYNIVQDGNEQVFYSQSILDYALMRLAESRLQLNQSQNSGLPVAVIQSRQASVVELEQNVSLLETLLTAAAVLIADKL